MEVLDFRKGSVIVDLKLDPEVAKRLEEDEDFLKKLHAQDFEVSGKPKRLADRVVDKEEKTYTIYDDTEGTITLFSGDRVELQTGLFEMGRVNGRVFHDLNGDGYFDSDETGIPDVKVRLYSVDGSYTEVLTSADGLYYFSERRPGEYYVMVEKPKGMTFSPYYSDSPTIESTERFKKSDVYQESGKSEPFSLYSGANATEINAGLLKLSVIKGILFEDMDGDGFFDEAIDRKAFGLQGARVEVYPSGSKELIQNVEIGVDGNYNIENLEPRAYKLKFIVPSYRFTTRHPLTPYSHIIQNNVNMLGEIDMLNIISHTETYVNVGYYAPTEISGVVWDDPMAEGKTTLPYKAVHNAKISLISQELGQEIETTASDNNGKFTFYDIAPGFYYVSVSLPPSYKLSNTIPKEMRLKDGEYLYNEISKTSKRSDVYVVRSGSPDISISIGVYRLSSIAGWVWDDVNANGQFEMDMERGIEDITVTLYDTQGKKIREAVTNKSGYYQFDNLEPGKYKSPVLTIPERYQMSKMKIDHTNKIDYAV